MNFVTRVGLGIVVAFGLLAGVQAIKPKPEISMQCTAKGDSGSCVIENKGGAGGDVQFDVAVVCQDGEHVANVSARVDAHNHVTKMIDGFAPEIGLFTKCVGIDYKNRHVK